MRRGTAFAHVRRITTVLQNDNLPGSPSTPGPGGRLRAPSGLGCGRANQRVAVRRGASLFFRKARMSKRKTTLGSQIRDARQAAGLTQRDLAERVDVRQPFIAAIEAGTKIPSVGLTVAIAAATKTTFSIDAKTKL